MSGNLLVFTSFCTDGGEHSSNFGLKNLFVDDTSIYRSKKSANVNIIAEFKGSCFELTRLIVRAPPPAFKSPVATGLLFVSEKPIKAEETSRFNDMTMEQFNTHNFTYKQIEPAACFVVGKRRTCPPVHFNPPRLGKYILIKLIRPFIGEYIEVEFIGLYGREVRATPEKQFLKPSMRNTLQVSDYSEVTDSSDESDYTTEDTPRFRAVATSSEIPRDITYETDETLESDQTDEDSDEHALDNIDQLSRRDKLEPSVFSTSPVNSPQHYYENSFSPSDKGSILKDDQINRQEDLDTQTDAFIKTPIEEQNDRHDDLDTKTDTFVKTATNDVDDQSDRQNDLDTQTHLFLKNTTEDQNDRSDDLDTQTDTFLKPTETQKKSEEDLIDRADALDTQTDLFLNKPKNTEASNQNTSQSNVTSVTGSVSSVLSPVKKPTKILEVPRKLKLLVDVSTKKK
eukprot:TRINITY_DN4704_c0_g1_i1.p1 TRINITY_DN4704_c0_g1~~TRINITY_DN4704_c0_g1_i1.p1  ORF type:complete len:467 (-),score=95.48 TRINITY_DN4704_c0_g1_i1:1043-2407(-)